MRMGMVRVVADTYITTRDVADVFHVDVSTVNRWVQMGRLESSRVGTGRTAPRVFNLNDVAEFGAALACLNPPTESEAA